MINAVLVINTQGKPRLAKFYVSLSLKQQQDVVKKVYALLASRAENSCNFVETDELFGPGTKLVYKHFATLYVIFVIDSAENELGILDLIQVFVETLDSIFRNVCELDIVFNLNKVNTVLDEIVVGGQIVETNTTEISKCIQEIARQGDAR